MPSTTDMTTINMDDAVPHATATILNVENLSPPPPAPAPTYPWQLKSGRAELLVDDVLIESTEQLERNFHPARKRPEPVIKAEAPWEIFPLGEMGIFGAGGVIYDETDKLWKAWLQVGEHATKPGCGYYTSEDSIQWERPNLGIIEFNASRDNNLVVSRETLPDYGCCVCAFKDTIDPHPQGRYKLFMSCKDWKMWDDPNITDKTRAKYYRIASSGDGTHWRFGEPFQHDGTADVGFMCIDEEAGKYRWYKRTRYIPDEVIRSNPEGERMMSRGDRGVSYLESPDLEHWDKRMMVFWTTPDMASRYDAHSMPVFKYGSHFIGLPSRTYFNYPACYWYKEHGLGWSRDGIHWTLTKDGILMVPPGEVGDWDRTLIYALNPVVYGDEIRIYYEGRNHYEPHNVERDANGTILENPEWRYYSQEGDPRPSVHDKARMIAHLGLATWPLDRFASLDASFDGGSLITKPLLLPEAKLWVNVKSDYGALTVEVMDEGGRAIRGLASEEIQTDGLRVPVKWKANAPIERLTTEPIRLKFSLMNTRLFSFGCGQAG